jgi:hypothetical protein
VENSLKLLPTRLCLSQRKDDCYFSCDILLRHINGLVRVFECDVEHSSLEFLQSFHLWNLYSETPKSEPKKETDSPKQITDSPKQDTDNSKQDTDSSAEKPITMRQRGVTKMLFNSVKKLLIIGCSNGDVLVFSMMGNTRYTS